MLNAADFIQGLEHAITQYPWFAVLVAFAGGALSTTTCPCTLPVGLGLVGYVGSNIDDDGSRMSGRTNASRIGIAFFVGLVLSLTALGIAAALVGRILAQWASTFAAATAVLTLGAGFFALLGPGIRRRIPDPDIRRRGGVGGAFVYGLLYSVATVTSSGGPLLLLLTVAAAIGRPVFGAGIAFAFALGRGAPFLLLGMFAGSSRVVSRLESFRRPTEVVSGVVLVGLSLYFVRLAAALA